jgi:hypothetical protein
MVTMTGNRTDDSGQQLSEEVELWRCDPVECIKELLGNPRFANSMVYASEKTFICDVREYSDINSGNWWWSIQVSPSLNVVV